MEDATRHQGSPAVAWLLTICALANLLFLVTEIVINVWGAATPL